MRQDFEMLDRETERKALPPTTRPNNSGRNALILGAIIVIIALFFFNKSRNRGTATPAGGSTAVKIAPAPPTPVQLGTVSSGSLTESVEVEGNIAALTEVPLSPKITARTLTVAVREGDHVSKGQLLVTLDTSDLDTQVRNAEEALSAAQAKADSARATYRWQQTQATSGIGTAKENLRGAKSRLAELEKGARSQEKLQAQSNVDVAQANLEDARTNYNRNAQLLRAGAIAKSLVDTAETNLKVKQAQLESAKQGLSLVEEGTRREEITQQEAIVGQAQHGLQQAMDNQQQVGVKLEDLRAAEAAVRQARTQVANAQIMRANAFIHSPVSGTVSRRGIDPGQMASPTSQLLSIYVPGTVFFGAAISETDVSKVHAGESVLAGVDSYPNDRFHGSVNRVYPAGDPSSRTFTARITVPDPEGKLKPGMFARGLIQTGQQTSVTLMPRSALTVAGGSVPISSNGGEGIEESVFVMKDGKAVKQAVRVGGPSGDKVQVISGLEPGDKVIVSGSNLQEGQAVHVAQ